MDKRGDEIAMTWTKKMLKNNAKWQMRISFSHYFSATVVYFIITMVPIIPMHFINDYANGTGVLLFYLFVLLAVVFIELPLRVGLVACYIRRPFSEIKSISTLFFAFSPSKYWPVVGAMLRMTIFIFLWSLLLVIPGIIKAYQYHMVPFILSESPEITGKEAMRISRQMTNGQKGDMFVLDLSFIGWSILASMPYTILITTAVVMLATGGAYSTFLVLYVISLSFPAAFTVYVYATYAQLYFVLRANYFASLQQPQ